jgi:hypothetical protein
MTRPGPPLSAAALLLAAIAAGASMTSVADGARPGQARAGHVASTATPRASTASSGAQTIPVVAPLLRGPDGAPGPPATASGSLPAPAPVRLQIPRLGIDATLGRVGLRFDGTIDVPLEWNQPAWYTGGPAPGTTGPAVIVGHLDSATGPAIFWWLATLRRGDPIAVTRDDGSVLAFRVTAVGDYPSAQFPTDAVYGATADSQLRLITCAGTWDRSAHQYTHNVVVFAVLR